MQKVGVCSLVETEGERWRAAELLGAGCAETLLTLQIYSEAAVLRLSLHFTLDQKKTVVFDTQTCVHTHILYIHALAYLGLLKLELVLPQETTFRWQQLSVGSMNTATHTQSTLEGKSHWPSAWLPFEKEVKLSSEKASHHIFDPLQATRSGAQNKQHPYGNVTMSTRHKVGVIRDIISAGGNNWCLCLCEEANVSYVTFSTERVTQLNQLEQSRYLALADVS